MPSNKELIDKGWTPPPWMDSDAARMYFACEGVETFKCISAEDFDAAFKANRFNGEPKLDSFGDRYGEPYNPNRAAYGVLKDGTGVWAWVRGPYRDKEIGEHAE